jgi:4'-phosphopantetheinyl transferase
MTSDAFWNLPPPELALGPDEVHVWRSRLDLPESAIADLLQVLSLEEQRRAARYYQSKDRRASIVGRGVLRKLLGVYLGIPAQTVEFIYNPHGRPELSAELAGGRLKFNLSHSGELVLHAFAWDRDVGIDVERPGRQLEFEALARRFFSRAENAALSLLPEAERRAAFFRCWTRKEAFIKATGRGLSYGLGRFDVTLAPDQPPRLLRAEYDDPANWSLRDLPAAGDYAAALAVESVGWSLRAWHFTDQGSSASANWKSSVVK